MKISLLVHFFVPTSDVSREFLGVLLVSKITSFSVTHSTRPHSGGRDFENVLILLHCGKRYLKENVRNFKKMLISYAITFGQRTFFSIIKLVFQRKHEFYLFSYNGIFKDCILFK